MLEKIQEIFLYFFSKLKKEDINKNIEIEIIQEMNNQSFLTSTDEIIEKTSSVSLKKFLIKLNKKIEQKYWYSPFLFLLINKWKLYFLINEYNEKNSSVSEIFFWDIKKLKKTLFI